MNSLKAHKDQLSSSYLSFPEELYLDIRGLFEVAIESPEHEGLNSEDADSLQSAVRSIKSSGKTRKKICLDFKGSEHPLTRYVAETFVYVAVDRLTAELTAATITPSQCRELKKRIERWRKCGSFVLPRKRNDDRLTEVDSVTRARSKITKKTHHAKVESEARAMIFHACKLLRDNESPVTVNKHLEKYLQIKFSWAASRVASNGGVANKRPWVSLALNELEAGVDKKTYSFTEYARIRDSIAIGSCHGSWRVYLAALVAHEMAHVAQYCGYIKNAVAPTNIKQFKREDLRLAHGYGWRRIYRHLRESWVNQMDGYKSGVET